MAEKNRGISPDLVIHPGETIADVLKEREMTQKELAKRAGVSEPFLSDVIHGKKDISKGLAMGLEYALGVPKSFWLNLQANYDAELLEIKEEETVDSEEIEFLESLRDVLEDLRRKSRISDDLTGKQTVIELRRIFQISRLTTLKSFDPVPLSVYSEDFPHYSNITEAKKLLDKGKGSEA